MVKPEKFGNLYLVYHFTIPLRKKRLVGSNSEIHAAQKMKFSIKDFFSKCGFGHISWKNP